MAELKNSCPLQLGANFNGDHIFSKINVKKMTSDVRSGLKFGKMSNKV